MMSSKLSQVWTDEVLQDGFTAIPNSLLRHARELGLDLSDLGFLVQLLSFRGPEGIHPSVHTLQARCGFTTRQAVSKRLRRLEQLGILKRFPVRDDQGHFSGYVYSINPLLERLRHHVNDHRTRFSSTWTKTVHGDRLPYKIEDITNNTEVSNKNEVKQERSSGYSSSIVRPRLLLKSMSIEPYGSRVKSLSRDDFVEVLKKLGFTNGEIGGDNDDS